MLLDLREKVTSVLAHVELRFGDETPETALEPRGTVGFRITLDQPDPHASRFEVTFAPNKPAEPKP